jgi:hypothetical protein
MQQARIVYFLGRIQANTIKDLWDNNARNWKNFEEKLDKTRGLPEWVRDAIILLISEFNIARGIGNDIESDSFNWSWKTNKSKGIKISARFTF